MSTPKGGPYNKKSPLTKLGEGLLKINIMYKINTISDQKQTYNTPEERLNAPVSTFKGCRGNTKAISVIPIGEVFERITNPGNTDLVVFTGRLKEGRAQGNDSYKEIKETESPAFIPGKFPIRKNNDCDEYVPLLGFDLDHCKEVKEIIEQLKTDRFVFAAYPSPSGEGIRVFIWTNSVQDSHKAYYQTICDHLSGVLNIPTDEFLKSQGKGNDEIKTTTHIDTSTNNPARLWFYTHVPKDLFYLNAESAVFEINPPDKPKLKPHRANSNGAKNGNLHSGKYVQEFSQKEKILNLVEQIVKKGIDITPGIENWFKTGCSLVSEFGESGRGIFQDVCQFHQDYDYNEVDKEYSRCLKKHDGSVTIATFYDLCKEKGVLVNYDILKAKYNGKIIPAGQPAKKDKFPIEKAKTKDIVNSFSICDTPKPANLYEAGNAYQWKFTDRNGEEKNIEISNFKMVPLYLLKHNSNPKRIFQIVNKEGDQATICVSSKTLSNKNELNAHIEGQGNFVPNWTTGQLVGIKQAIYYNVPEAEEIEVLGYQSDKGIYVFSNGAFDGNLFYEVNDFGVVDLKDKTIYIPVSSSVNQDAKAEFINERKFRYIDTPVTLEEWSNQINKVYGNNGKIGICFLIAILFRDLVFFNTDFFPLLFLFGQPRSGKSAFRESFLSLFGEPQSAISLGSASSAKGFSRKLAQFSNALICFEEYKNNIKPSLIEMLKSMYDGIGYERAQISNDNRTHSTPVLSGCIVAGQEMPIKESALFSRSILLEFSQVLWDNPDDYNLLKKMEDQGLGNVLLQILSCRQSVKEQFKRTFDQIFQDVRKDNKTRGISDRNVKNIASILTPFKILSKELRFPFEFSEAFEFIKGQLVEQQKIMLRTSEVSHFWQSFEYLVRDKRIHQGIQFKKDIKDGENILYVIFQDVYPLYYKHANEQNLHTLDKETLLRYLKLQNYYVDGKGRGQHQIRIKQNRNPEWVYAFLFDSLQIEI